MFTNIFRLDSAFFLFVFLHLGFLSRNMLVEFLDDHCMLENNKLKTKNSEEHVVSAFDFVYLPIDFRYAYITCLHIY
jgi:hypothetical protein